MLRSCAYCGRIHDIKIVCRQKEAAEKIRAEKRKSYKKNAVGSKFRNSNVWRNKSLYIRKRDKFLCQCCLNEYEGTMNKYNDIETEVHHIVPIEEDYDKRLDNNNLITLCRYHHEQAEQGKIRRQELFSMINDEEDYADDFVAL